MMKQFIMMALVLPVLALGGCLEKASHSTGVSLDGGYSFATASMQKNGVVGGMLVNQGGEDVVIVSARGDVSERIELHTHIHENGVMKMREVKSYMVPANGSLKLGPMGEHIMLMGLKGKLETGDQFSVTLIDDEGGTHDVSVNVRAPGDMPE